MLINGDCITELRKLADDSIDVCFADPPFNLNKSYKSSKDNLSIDEYLKWCESWLLELIRVTKPTGSIFVHNIPKWLTHYTEILNKRAVFKHWISWDAMSTPLGKTLLPAHYGILFYGKSDATKFYEVRAPHKRCRVCDSYLKDYGGKKHKIHPFGYLLSDVWTDIHRIRHRSKRDDHPCQLPIHLLERIILMSSDEGDTILDPFSGTGTTGIAAKRLNRNYIGIELDTGYFTASERKISEVTNVVRYRGFTVSMHLNKIQTIRDRDIKALSDAHHETF